MQTSRRLKIKQSVFRISIGCLILIALCFIGWIYHALRNQHPKLNPRHLPAWSEIRPDDEILLTQASEIYSLCFSHDGKYLFVGLRSKGIECIDLEKKQVVATLDLSAASKITVSPNNKFVAALRRGTWSDASVWEIGTWKALASRDIQVVINDIAIQDNPPRLLLATVWNSLFVLRWDPEVVEERTQSLSTFPITTIQLTTKPQWCWIGDECGNVTAWDYQLTTLQCRIPVNCYRSPNTFAGLYPAVAVVSSKDFKPTVVDFHTKSIVKGRTPGDDTQRLWLPSNGRILVSREIRAPHDEQMTIWDAKTMQIHSEYFVHPADRRILVWHPNNQQIAITVESGTKLLLRRIPVK